MGEDYAAIVCLVFVCCWDLKEKRIPNGLLLAGAGLCLFFKASGQPPGVLTALLQGGAALLLASPLWLLRMAGAGDVKLAALIVGWMGVPRGLTGLALGLALGAVWSLVRLLRGRELFLRLRQLALYVAACLRNGVLRPYPRWEGDGEAAVIPLGAYLALGTILILFF